MGLRLPLDSLPWSAEGDRDEVYERDPFAPRSALPLGSRRDRRDADRSRRGRAVDAAPSSDGVRMRRVAQARRRSTRHAPDRRSGLPPAARGPAAGVRRADCRLGADRASARARRIGARRRSLGAVRRAAQRRVVRVHAAGRRRSRAIWIWSRPLKRRRARLGLRVLLEGYPPPHDPRLPHIQVTPDPGVIEVNVQPAANWDQLVEQTTTLYEEARQVGLDHREVHGRRTAYRHRRRQSLRAGRLVAGRQSVPAASGSAAQPGELLAQPSVAVVSVLGTVSRSDEPGAARRRSPARQRLRAGDCVLAPAVARDAGVRRGWSIGRSGICWST